MRRKKLTLAFYFCLIPLRTFSSKTISESHRINKGHDLFLFCNFLFLLGALYFRRVCEGQSLSINCGARVIDILSASYGRTQQGLCGRNGNTNCHAGTSMRVARFECQQQHRCVLYAKNSEFGDPCKGTVKYLQVRSELNYLESFRMMTATTGTTPSKKWIWNFIFEFRNCLVLFSTPKYVTPGFNSKRKYQKLATVVRFPKYSKLSHFMLLLLLLLLLYRGRLRNVQRKYARWLLENRV